MKYLKIILILVMAYAVCLGAVGLGELSHNIYKGINQKIVNLEEKVENKIDLIEYYQDEQSNDQLDAINVLYKVIKNIETNLTAVGEVIDSNSSIVDERMKELTENNVATNKKIQENKTLTTELYKYFASENEKPLYEYMKSVTVRIYQQEKKEDDIGGLGTGTVVKMTEDATYILTNKHVATEGHYIVLLDEDNETIVECQVIKNDELYDLSLIKAPIRLKNKQAFKGFGEIDYQERVYSVGMFLGLKYIYTQGTMAGYASDGDFLMNTPAGPGCSGSGMFNKNGELVAVIYAGHLINYFQMDTARSICVKGKNAQEFLEKLL